MATIHLKAAAGGAGGSWYVLMEGLARLIAEMHPQVHIEVVEGGGVANHVRIGSGELPMGILNPPVTAAAIAGRTPYGRAYPELRVGVSNLSVNYLHCCVERHIPLASVEAWTRQQYPLRMPVDRVGTVDRLVFQLLLGHFGVSEADVQRRGGILAPAVSCDAQLDLYSRNEVNALWQFMGIPSPSIQAAHTLRPLKVLPFPDRLITEAASRRSAILPHARAAPLIEGKYMTRDLDHHAMLQIAIAEARQGLTEGGIPIGAALLDRQGNLLGRGHNRRVQEDDPSAHGETDAFRKAGRQRHYRDTIMVTTLAPCWYCSGLVRQFRIGTVVVGESVNFSGGIGWLRENGVEVIELNSPECVRMLADYIAANPNVWHEDIGEA